MATSQYNLTDGNSRDLTAVANVADGNANFDIPISTNSGVSVQLIYDDTDANDDTWKLYGSENGIDWFIYPNANTITSTITASKVTDGWQTEQFRSMYMRVAFAKGSSTTGTYAIILTTKN